MRVMEVNKEKKWRCFTKYFRVETGKLWGDGRPKSILVRCEHNVNGKCDLFVVEEIAREFCHEYESGIFEGGDTL